MKKQKQLKPVAEDFVIQPTERIFFEGKCRQNAIGGTVHIKQCLRAEREGLMTQVLSVWKGSEKTAEDIEQQIAERWGQEEARNYDPLKNCFTFKRWKQEGYKIKKGEKSLRTITIIAKEKKSKVKDKKTGEERTETKTVTYPKTVCLFYIKQVEKVS